MIKFPVFLNNERIWVENDPTNNIGIIRYSSIDVSLPSISLAYKKDLGVRIKFI